MDKFFHSADEGEFLRMIRKPPEFFNQIIEGLKFELKAMGEIKDITSAQKRQRDELQALLTPAQRKSYLKTIFTNMCFSKPISANFAKSALALPTMGSSIYSHLFAGLSQYTMEKRQALGMGGTLKVQNAGAGACSALPTGYYTPCFYREPVTIATYYRSPILMEELESVRGGLVESLIGNALT